MKMINTMKTQIPFFIKIIAHFFLHCNMPTFIISLLFLLVSMGCFSQTEPSIPKTYNIFKTTKAPTIDGKIGRGEWKNARWTDEFVDISDSINPIPKFKTKCKMLWDDEYLYIAAYLEEPDLWATLKNHDNIIYNDNDFEVFIDPGNDASNYFEIEINALGTVMDLFMLRTYKRGGPVDMKWNTVGMKSAVYLKGTLNDNTDKDKYWTIEMAIPYSCLERPNRISRPSVGATWRINFSRVQWQSIPSGTTYTKKKTPEGKRIPEYNWVWTPQGRIDMHIPEKWGYLNFKDHKK